MLDLALFIGNHDYFHFSLFWIAYSITPSYLYAHCLLWAVSMSGNSVSMIYLSWRREGMEAYRSHNLKNFGIL